MWATEHCSWEIWRHVLLGQTYQDFFDFIWPECGDGSFYLDFYLLYIYNNIDIYIIYIYNVHTHISEVSWSFLRVSPSSLLLAMLRFRDSAWNPSRWGACLSSLPKRCAGVDCHWNRHSLAGKIHWNSKLIPEVFILFHLCIFLKTISPIGEDSDVP